MINSFRLFALDKKTMKNLILPLICALSATASCASTISIEGFAFSVLNGDLKDTGHTIDLYANGVKVISQGTCTHAEPCKVDVNKKATLTLCNSKWINYCQTRIVFDPADGALQRFAFVFAPSTYAAVPYTVYRPEEITIIDEQLRQQQEFSKVADETKSFDRR